MLVFQLLLRARGRNHLTPLSTALSTPGSRSNVVTSSRTQHFVLLRYNFVTSFNFLSTAQPRGDEMNRTQKSYARCLSYPIPHAQWFFNREETRDGGSVANIFPAFAHVGLLVGFTVQFFSPTGKKGFKMDLYKDERDLVYRPFSTSSRSSVRMFEGIRYGDR